MIICINCSPDIKAKMDNLLKSGQYSDYSELFALSIENLYVLEREAAEKGPLVMGETQQTADAELVAATKHPKKGASKPVHKPSKSSNPVAPNRDNTTPPAIPELFLVAGLDGAAIPAVDVQTPVANSEEVFTLDHWLFGQHNKLLPAKANCRALAHLYSLNLDGISLDVAAPRIAEDAAILGDYLADHDRRHKIVRDEALATAFPRSGPEGEKSRARYAHQFVGSLNSQGVLSGLLWDYRLAALGGMGVSPMNHGQDARATSTPNLSLTEAGLGLARLQNPALDSCQADPTQKFSPEEVSFILDHIRSHVPVEAFAFRTLIQAISDGANTPDTLDKALRALVPTDTNRSLSPSFLTSQRSGALSRMADLSLVARERKGVRVSYLVTDQGQAHLAATTRHTA